MQDETIRRHVVAHGRVQGVSFRDAVRRRADQHSVNGWVRNRSDGAVEAVLEGRAGAVQEMLRFFEAGPRHADVEDVEVSEEAPEGLASFEVR